VEGPEDALVGVPIRLKAGPIVAHSDHAGRFFLPVSARGNRLTASKEGFFIAGTNVRDRRTILRLRPIPQDDHESYEWVDPTPLAGDEQRCGNCHSSIWQEWSRSGHSRSAMGKQFLDLYDGTDWHGQANTGWGLLTERPDGAGVCSSCHAPSLREDDPALLDLRHIKDVPRQGVHCDYCHKIAGLGEGEIGLTHGRYLLRLLRPREGQLFFGPLDDVDRGEDVYSAFYRDSRYCAACHEGVVFGVRVYSTYSEWLASPARQAGQHCQHCHMKPTGKLSNIAPGRGGVERDPHTLGNHLFWNTSQLEMLRRSLRLDVHPWGSQVRVRLTATGVGHRIPTGFIDRHLLLVVEARGSRGERIERISGPTLPSAAGPEWTGQPGRLYARLLKDDRGRSPVPFWRALPEADDTRLVPDQPDEQTFVFATRPSQLRIRLVHRRFWAETVQAKRWPAGELLVIDRTVSCLP
jgi:hypothetical protein